MILKILTKLNPEVNKIFNPDCIYPTRQHADGGLLVEGEDGKFYTLDVDGQGYYVDDVADYFTVRFSEVMDEMQIEALIKILEISREQIKNGKGMSVEECLNKLKERR